MGCRVGTGRRHSFRGLCRGAPYRRRLWRRTWANRFGGHRGGFRRCRLRRRQCCGFRRCRLGRWRRRRFRWRHGCRRWRCRLGLRGRCRRRLFEHELKRRLIRWGRRQRRCYDHDQGRDRGGVQQDRRQCGTEMPGLTGRRRRTAVLRHTYGNAIRRGRHRSRTTPFWNVITYHHKRLSSCPMRFGKSRLLFRAASKSGTIAG